MILGIELPVTTLGKWLEIATYDLVAPAKERIRVEIEAHYAEAVANHIAQGVSKAEAEMAALAELGPAPTAAKKFRERYLAESEAIQLQGFIKVARFWPWLLISCFIFCISIFTPARHGDNTVLLFTVEFTCFVVLPMLLFFMARSPNVKANGLFILTILVFFSLCLADTLLRHVTSVGPSLFVLVYFKPISQFFHACYKSLRWRQTWPEEPPQDTALS